jgi:hypothetical protein
MFMLQVICYLWLEVHGFTNHKANGWKSGQQGQVNAGGFSCKDDDNEPAFPRNDYMQVLS